MVNAKITYIKQKSRKIMPYLLLYICISILLILSRSIGYKPSNNGTMTPIELTKGWTVFEDGEKTAENITMPYLVKDKKAHQIDLFITLPEIPYEYTILTAYKDELNLTLLLDNEVLLESNFSPSKHEKKVNGTSFLHLPLVGNPTGKELHLKLNRTNFPFYTISPEVSLHDSLDTRILFLSRNHLGFFLMTTIATLGLLLLIVTLLTSKKKIIYSPQLYLALFVFVTSLWVLCNTRAIQFFTENTLLIHYLEYISFYSIPTLIWAYIWLNWHKFGNLSITALTMNLTLFIAVLTLKLVNVSDFISFRSFFHLIILMNALVLIYVGVKLGLSATKSLRIFFVGFLLFAICCVIDIIRFYLSFSPTTMTTFFQLGLVLMLICLTLSYALTINEKIKTQINASIYKNLAYSDKLTGLRSRLAFEEDLEQLQRTLKPQDELVMVNIDFNDFKQINDTFGHLCGDNVLKLIADALNSLFHGIAQCYRIGGDEFCIIAINHDAGEIQKLLYKLNPLLQQNKNNFSVSASFGIAVYNRFLHSTLNEVFESADSRMYQNKARSKIGRI